MPMPDMMMIDGVEYRRADRDAPEAKDPTLEAWDAYPRPWVAKEGQVHAANDAIVWARKPNKIPTRIVIAAEIVAAVNHHADLVAFVERIVRYAVDPDNTGLIWKSFVEDSRELLAKVKGT